MSRGRGGALALLVLAGPVIALAGTMDGLATSLTDAGLAAHTKGDDKTAEKKLKEAVKTCGASGCAKKLKVDALLDLGAVQAALGKTADAKESFTAALKLDPSGDLAKALKTSDVATLLDSVRSTVTGKPIVSAAPAASSAPPVVAPPPPAPIALVPTKKVDDASWVEGVGLVRSVPGNQGSAATEKSLMAPEIPAPPNRGAWLMGISLASYTPHPNGTALCPTAKAPEINLGVGWNSFNQGDALGIGFGVGLGLLGLGSVGTDVTNPCSLGGQGISFSSPLRFLGEFSLDYHPPAMFNGLGIGPFIGIRGQMWVVTVAPGSTAPAASNSPAFDLGAEYGGHARYTLGSLASYSVYLDGSYRLRWSGTRRGDYGKVELGFMTSGVVLALTYETLLKAVGGDLTDANPATLYANNVPLDSEIGFVFGLRF